MTMNLKKYITLLTIFFGIIVFFVIFPKSVFAGEWANRGQTCAQYCASTGRSCITTYNTGGTFQTVGSSCSSSFTLSCDYVYPDQICCGCQGAPPANPCAPFPQFPVYCPAINRCIPTNWSCTNFITNCGGNSFWFCPNGYTATCSNNQPGCCPAGYDCSTQTNCGGQQWYCPSGYRINCGPPVTCQSTATPTPRPSVCVPNSIRNVCSTTSCSL